MKSNKRTIYKKSALAVFALLVLGGCSCSTKPQESTGNPAQNQAATPENSMPKPGLLGMLMGQNAVKCHVVDKTGTYDVLSKGGKVKIDGINFQPTTIPPVPPTPDNLQAQTKTGTMISDGKILYMWSGTSGIKMNIDEAQANQPKTGDSANPTQNWSEWAKQMEASGATYQCDNANISDSEFSPPQDVKFQDFSQMMQNLPKAVTPENKPVQLPDKLPYNGQPQ